MGIKASLIHVYDAKYKAFMLFSLLLLLLCLGVLGYKYATTGEFVQKGVSLKGGLTITIPLDKDFDQTQVQSSLENSFPKADITVRKVSEAGTTQGIIVEAADVKTEEVLEALHKQLVFDSKTASVEEMGSSLGASFYAQTIQAVFIAFIFMAIVVFITFRNVVPSTFVILAAASDILSTLAIISLLNIRLSTAGIAAFLMLIGYSVDTDILLTTRVLKQRQGTIFERTMSAFKTGMLMTITSLTATTVGLLFTQSDTIKQIMLILTIGLLFDMIYTWCQNAGILRLYLERKEKHAAQTSIN